MTGRETVRTWLCWEDPGLPARPRCRGPGRFRSGGLVAAGTRDDGAMEVRRGDGSVIAVEVAGEQGAAPVLLCHGLADSRLSARLFSQAARELGLCIVAPDRPGVGGTDSRRLAGWRIGWPMRRWCWTRW